MCGIFLSISIERISNDKLSKANHYIQYRGPNSYRIYRMATDDGRHLCSAHYLLDVSGKSTAQPLILKGTDEKPRLLLLFNGEIYNYNQLVPDARSDTDALARLLSDQQLLPFHKLEGEYAIALYDFVDDQVIIATDQFMTKPLCVGWSDDKRLFGVASYHSALKSIGATQISYATPNHVQKFYMKHSVSWQPPSKEPESNTSIYKYLLDQSNSSYAEWECKFLESVSKRGRHGSLPIFVPLSSGYDSGAICLALNILGIGYRTISINCSEDRSVLERRCLINQSSSGSCIEHINLPILTAIDRSLIRAQISRTCEHFSFIHSDQTLLDDPGSLGAYRVAQIAQSKGWYICISGTGSDEIISDYGFRGEKYYSHSQFGGLFPGSLSDIFPWKKFYQDSMRSYILKDEIIYGAFGIEARYPFLDFSLTQAFLSLSSDLKNMSYKAPITYFLNKYGYPYEDGAKRGFSPWEDSTTDSLHSRLFERFVSFFISLPSTLRDY